MAAGWFAQLGIAGAAVDPQIIVAIDTARPDSEDMTAVSWWKRNANGSIECLDIRTFPPVRTHDDDLLGEMSMSPAGFWAYPALMAGMMVGQPELDYARSAAEFGDAFGPTARTRIAQERMNHRLDAKRIRQLRYRRMMARRAAH